MFRYPDISKTHIAFVWAGDVWLVAKEGGEARRLTDAPGEETNPRFSPHDGSRIALTANYHGSDDVYVMAVDRSDEKPVRLTHHPASDLVLDWYPDGKSVLYASAMESGAGSFCQLYRISADGGPPQKLPLRYGGMGAFSPDGRWLAFQTVTRDYSTWKRYRGGRAPDILLFDLEHGERPIRNLTYHDANDSHPMWHPTEEKLFFLSDRGDSGRFDIWVLDDLDAGVARQITFEDVDVRYPAIGPDAIVFVLEGKLFTLPLEQTAPGRRARPRELEVMIPDRRRSVERTGISDRIVSFDISPSGDRAVLEARGEIFTVTRGWCRVRNLTRSPGSAQRFPAWSPDGELIAYHTDAGGEYQLAVQSSKGSPERLLTSYASGFRYRIHWSPDSKRLAFIDHRGVLSVVDSSEGRGAMEIDRLNWMTPPALQGFCVSWSPCSRWLAYSKGVENDHHAIFLCRLGRILETVQLTSGYHSDTEPVFDPLGKRLYYLTHRIYEVPVGEDQVRLTTVAHAALHDGDGAQRSFTRDDLEGFESRSVLLIVPGKELGHLSDLHVVGGDRIAYLKRPFRIPAPRYSAAVLDIHKREESILADNVVAMAISSGRQSALIQCVDDGNQSHTFFVDFDKERVRRTKIAVDRKPRKAPDPRPEWQQIYWESWRLMRDFFYDEKMHGVDWKRLGDHYAELLGGAATRWDVNHIIGELVGELNSSHVSVGGGDLEQVPRSDIGLLGAELVVEHGAYRVARILSGGPWDNSLVASPLFRAGVEVGDYLLEVDGQPIDPNADPWAPFQGLAERVVSLKVGPRPEESGSHDLKVRTLGWQAEWRLRNLAWIEENRREVARLSDGRVGYVFIPSTGSLGHNRFFRQLEAYLHLEGLVLDLRFNVGGDYPHRMLELMSREPLATVDLRYGQERNVPALSRNGAQAMLINSWTSSSGELLAWTFRRRGFGKLIGTRTWGGLTGLSNRHPLIDGGEIATPHLPLVDSCGNQFIEGIGVEPDITVADELVLRSDGPDRQLERAVEVVLERLEHHEQCRLYDPT
jgi:tricorn protease